MEHPEREEDLICRCDKRETPDGAGMSHDDRLAVMFLEHPPHGRSADDVGDREDEPCPDAVIAHQEHRQKHPDAPGPAHPEVDRPRKPASCPASGGVAEFFQA